MIPRKPWLLWSAAAAVAVYVLMWIGYVLQWNWLATIDTASLDALHRHGVARPGWVTSWNVFCTLLGPTAFRLLALVVIGIGRVVLNVHHPSDVLAGWSLGYAYFVACLLLVPPRRPVTVVDETPATPGIAR